MTRQRQSGFTLIEIMLAVAILAILAAIALPAYNRYIQESRYGTALQDMRQMQVVMDDLASDDDLIVLDQNDQTVRGVYMAADGTIQIGDTNQATATATGAEAWLDPWDNMYRYQRADNNNQDYVLWSFGPNRTDNGGGGDDASPN